MDKKTRNLSKTTEKNIEQYLSDEKIITADEELIDLSNVLVKLWFHDFISRRTYDEAKSRGEKN